MARIAIGLPSGGLGHVSQALALARALPEHEILFLRGGEREALRSEGFEVAAIPTMRTHYRGHSIDTLRTGWEGTRNLFVAGRRTKKVVSILRDFGPDLVLTSYEPYTPLAAGRLGIPCIGIDNQRAITEGRYDAVGLIPWWRGAFAIPYLLWFRTPEYLAFNSFAVSEVRDRAKARAFRPLLAPEVLDLSPRKGDHVVAYQTTATSRALLKTLERLDVPCH
ncbi:MAG: hypothetical protein KC416_17370, partial [Myxococcales bacterium]|nr:hypothetical protein [Myxococcales bacterium]